jgi:hypothetical protein
MILSRDNKPKFLAGHMAAAATMRTRVTACMTGTYVPVIVAVRKKEAAP